MFPVIFTIDDVHNFTGSLFVSGNINLPDTGNAKFGDSNDLRIRHDGSNSIIQAEGTGDLVIRQDTADKDILLRSDDGSGGIATYITLDGSATKTTLQKDLRADDDVKIQVGSSGDFYMVHDSGTGQGQLINGTDHLVIVNNANDHDIILKSDDGSGGTTNYITLDGSTAKLILQRPTFIGSHFGAADSQLHVSESFMEAHIGSGSLMTVFETKGTSGNPDFKIVDKDNNNARAALQVQGNAGAIECLFVASAGNVGVGTTSPGAKLEVIGDVSASLTSTGSFGALAVGISSPLGHLHINTETAQATIGYIDGEASQDKVLLFRHYGNSEAAGHLQYAGFIGSVVDNVLTLGHYDNSASEIQALNIAEDGDVGIGTTSPDTSLDVRASGVHGLVINQDEANADISSRLFFKEQNSTIALYNTGDTFSFRTGATIGSTSGTERATINSNGQVLATEFVGNSDANTGLRVAGSDALSLKTGGTTALSIDSSQETTLAGNLDVAGNTKLGSSISHTHDITGSLEVSGTLNIPTGSITVEGGIGGANIARFSRNQGTQRTDIDIHAGSGDPQITFSSPSGRDYSIGQDISENTFVISEHTGVGTEDRLIVRDDGDVFISQSLDFRAEHAADKIVLYNGGSEKIGTSAHTMILTATSHSFKDTDGHENLKITPTGDLVMLATGKLFFDGSDAGHTYISEVGADTLKFFVGGQEMLKLLEGSDDRITVGSTSHLVIQDNKALIFGGSDDVVIKHDTSNGGIIVIR